MIKKYIGIWSVPRSGSSWLGQIFNSSSKTVYRYQPLFSYKYKNFLNEKSTKSKIKIFLKNISVNEDNFLKYGLANKKEIQLLQFYKENNPTHLVFKNVRYLNLIELFLKNIETFQLVCLIRNPCATLVSWKNAKKEFDKSWDFKNEWRYAEKKNNNHNWQYFGYEKWKEAVKMFLFLKNKYPKKVKIISYDELLENTNNIMLDTFNFVNLNFENSIYDFIKNSSKYSGETYSVFRKKKNDNFWKKELDPKINEKIYKDLKKEDLLDYYE